MTTSNLVYGVNDFVHMVGRQPAQDDLDRVNCVSVGELMHSQCGVCSEHKMPRFECGCVHVNPEP